MNMQSDINQRIGERSERLQQVAAELKQELFGIDNVIDRVVDSIRAWYVMPEIISRPVIVCLWGLTGTGKTQLTRLLAQKLGFYDRFVEVQMDGFSHTSGHRPSTISGLLAESGVSEGEPGILVLDEFQRYRTVDKGGDEIKVERYQDVWTLLSDGKLAPALNTKADMEYSLGQSQYHRERQDDNVKREITLSPWEAREIKQTLKLTEPLLDIMRWTPEQLNERMAAFANSPQDWGTDYSKLLVFVSGNLDEMYEYIAKQVEDCDTDADIFHELTRKLSMIHVKKALRKRFKPEQIARLGNNHVIYPSLNRRTYQRLIEQTCGRYVREMAESTQLKFELTPALLDEIYANAVFPAQGTRPMFSSIHAILSAPLVDATLWALEQGAQPKDRPVLGLDPTGAILIVTWNGLSKNLQTNLELRRLRQRTNTDFRALLAVHEAGHGLLYGVLFGRVPQEIKINVASFDGGYNSYQSLRAESRRNRLDSICVSLGGRAAEKMVFGREACTTGSEHDYRSATEEAAQYVRHLGFGERLSRTDVSNSAEDNVNTDVQPTNEAIEALMQEQHQRAERLLQRHRDVFTLIVQTLMKKGEVSRQEMAQWLDLPLDETDVLEPYARRLDQFLKPARQAQVECDAVLQGLRVAEPVVCVV